MLTPIGPLLTPGTYGGPPSGAPHPHDPRVNEYASTRREPHRKPTKGPPARVRSRMRGSNLQGFLVLGHKHPIFRGNAPSARYVIFDISTAQLNLLPGVHMLPINALVLRESGCSHTGVRAPGYLF